VRFRRASLVVAFLAVVGLCVAGIASSAGTQAVTATATGVIPSTTTCTPPVQKGNVTFVHCTNGQETWAGDITGHGTYSYDRVTNLTTGARNVINGVETIENASIRGTGSGTLYSRWNENDLPAGSSAPDTFHIEQSFQGGTGTFTKAHGSVRFNTDLNAYVGQVGF
jgi:hypothetical protein